MQSLLCLALSNAVVATLLAVFAAVVARYCRRPSVRHALWLLVLLKLITPPLLPLSVTWPRSEEVEPTLVEQASSAVVLPDVLAGAANGRRQPAGEGLLDPADDALYQPADAGRSPYLFGDVWIAVLIVIWFGGSVTWWSVAAVRLRKFRRLLWQARPAPADVQVQGRRLAVLLALRHCPSIVFVSAPLSPMLWALGFSPRVLIPAELWRKLTADQQDTLLAHELAHLRRGDHWVRRLEFLVLGLYWWHPVVWWARRQLQEAEEECCDALVVAVLPEAAPAYASALVETVAFLSQTRTAAPVGASGAGHVPLLKRRLTMILSETSFRKPSRFGFWIVLGLGALLLPLAPEAARTEAPKEPQSVESAGRPVALDFGFPVANRAVRNADDIRNCIACHAMPDPHRHALQQPWKGIHDELLRLTEEYNRELRKTGRLPSQANDRSRAEEIENLQDDIELLKAQVQLKERRVSATEKTLGEYRKRLKTYQEINRKQPGSIPTDTLMGVQLEITNHEGQLQVNEAELQESRVRLKQAERRLVRLQGPAVKTDDGVRPQQEKRMRELEQKVENLLKEIQKLREDMRPNKPHSWESPP